MIPSARLTEVITGVRRQSQSEVGAVFFEATILAVTPEMYVTQDGRTRVGPCGYPKWEGVGFETDPNEIAGPVAGMRCLVALVGVGDMQHPYVLGWR